MDDTESWDQLIAFAETIRRALQESDRLGLLQVSIHLDSALNSIAKFAPDGVVQAEPYAFPDERDA